jgi:DNA polymerase I-like protein with 3'-5' exonuclease and polymerase domains
MALAYVDYEQQEFGIAAALSGDHAMREAYESGDPYLSLAKQCGAVSSDATKESHADVREQFKLCVLGIQYGMGAPSLATAINGSVEQARELIEHHRRVFRRYWDWSNDLARDARKRGVISSV